MSTGLIIAVTFAYVGVAASEAWKANWSMAMVFLGYSIANLGIIMGVK